MVYILLGYSILITISAAILAEKLRRVNQALAGAAMSTIALIAGLKEKDEEIAKIRSEMSKLQD